MRRTILTIALLSLTVYAGAETYRVDWQTISSGGGEISGGTYKMKSTVGQPAAGFERGVNVLHWVGFWAGEVPRPVLVTNVNNAKLLSDGTFVSVSGKIATSAAADFANFFYIEESGRSSGIRVASAPVGISGLARGSVVSVVGSMNTLPSGERQIAGPIVTITSTAAPLTPVGMPGRSIGGGNLGTPPAGQIGVTGGSGLNNVGLLIQTWGRVTATGVGYVMIDDGSGPVRLDTTNIASPPTLHSYVSVMGVSSLYESGGDHLRLMLLRGSDAITTY